MYIQNVNLDVNAQPDANAKPCLRLSQNENGRVLMMRIIGVDIPEGSTANFAGLKPDGNVYSKPGTVDGNVVSIEEDIQMTAVSGSWNAKIAIVNDGNTICTARIRVVVDASLVPGDAIPSDSQLDGIVAECQAYAESAKSAAYGSPLTANTAADMTDQNRVYVYTGSETGYTAGHWYYYDGSAWTDGGVYNAVAVQTDTTLTQAGKAADAKETGDQITELKEDLNDVNAELADVRVGADGVTYGSAGAAVRGQINNIKNDFNAISGELLYDGSKSYAGGTENWRIKDLTPFTAESYQLAIKIYTNSAGVALEVAYLNGTWKVAETITDDKWHIVDIPSGTTSYLNFTYKGEDPLNMSAIVMKVSAKNIESDIVEIESDIADIKDNAEDLTSIVSNLKDDSLETLVTYPNSGYINTSGSVVANANFFYSDYIAVNKLDIDVNIYWHNAVATFTFYDSEKNYINKYIKRETNGNGMEKRILTIPDDAVYVIVCTDTTYNNKVYTFETKSTLDAIKAVALSTTQSYGNHGTPSTTFISSFLNFAVCPCKKADKTGKITSIYVKSYSSGTAAMYVGEVDQLHLFVPRKSFDVDVVSGEQNIDVSNLDIFIEQGEQVLFQFIGQTPFKNLGDGDPEGDNSFYYSSHGTLQLEVYGAQKAINFGFGYTVESSTNIIQDKKISKNTDDIATIQDNVSIVQSSINIISDRQGNKYKMIVQNGAIALLAMNFKHVLCVGNSYTTHPTTSDNEADYRNNLWWGHWSMAASSSLTAWTSLLQTALRQKINDAVVTPVFGRRYETSYNVYTVDNPNTFTYWDDSEWKSLKNNLESFSDVDAVVFFLGANYTGDDWHTLYSDMVDQYLEWFPNATIFCCSSYYGNNAEKDSAIQQVANEKSATYISMTGTATVGQSKIGSYVYGDDNNLHQINNSAVANHYGDYGEYLILDRICNAMGYTNNATLYNITISAVSGVTLSVISTKTLEGAVVSVFAEIQSGTTLSSITVTDAGNNSISVTDHGVTDYGRVFTFVMPSSNVTIAANVS